MGKATFRQAADGLPARVAPSWTEEKLMILEAYLDAFADACKSAGGWYSLDLFAGNGLNWSEVRGREINGSPLIALEAGSPGPIEVVMAERHTGAYEALCARISPYGGRAQPLNDDANKIVGDMLARVPRRAPAFAFLDPEGSELAWPTVEAVANHERGYAHNKIEQLILLPTDMGFIRLVPDHPDKVTGMYGHSRCQEIEARRRAGKLDPDEARSEYVRLYATGLKESWLCDRVRPADQEADRAPNVLSHLRDGPRRGRTDHGPLLRPRAAACPGRARAGSAIPNRRCSPAAPTT